MRANLAGRKPPLPKHRFRTPCGLCTSYTCDGYCDKLTDDETPIANLLPPHHDTRHSSWAG